MTEQVGFYCPLCQDYLTVGVNWGAQRATCPQCKTSFMLVVAHFERIVTRQLSVESTEVSLINRVERTIADGSVTCALKNLDKLKKIDSKFQSLRDRISNIRRQIFRKCPLCGEDFYSPASAEFCQPCQETRTFELKLKRDSAFRMRLVRSRVEGCYCLMAVRVHGTPKRKKRPSPVASFVFLHKDRGT